MSDEITVNYGLSVRKGSLVFAYPQNALRVDMAGNLKLGNTQDIGTVTSGLNVAGNTFTPGYAVFTNLSTTSGQYINVTLSARLYPGEVALIPIASLAGLSGSASSGTAKLDYNILER